MENDLTLEFVIDYLIRQISEDYSVSESKAKYYLSNALLYNVVISEIENQIDFLLECENKEAKP